MSDNNFAHGVLHGDHWGVNLYGPPIEGSWSDRLELSDRFVDPLFHAILDAIFSQTSVSKPPRVVVEWNTCEGWAGVVGGIAEIAASDARDLIEALARVSADGLRPHVAGATVEECLECASAMAKFITSRLLRGGVYIEGY